MKRLIFLLVLLALMGCQQQNTGNLPDFSSAFTGTEGLSMKFMENAPPATVPSQSYVPIGLMLENKGAADINDGVIVIRYPEDIMVVEKDRIEVNIEGKETTIVGGKQITILDGLTKRPGMIGTEKPKARIAATSCYDYQTKLSTGICINPDSFGVKKASGRKPACEQKDASFSGQGAPVAITKIDATTISRGEQVDVQVKAYIANKNRGVIYRKGTNYCSSSGAGEKTVFVRASLLGKDASCLPGEFALSERSEENYVTCIFSGLPASDAFVTQLSIVAEYGYSETISKDFLVDTIQATCRECSEIESYSRIIGIPQCQEFPDGGRYMTAAHEKCYHGCYVEFPDYTTSPPTPC